MFETNILEIAKTSFNLFEKNFWYLVHMLFSVKVKNNKNKCTLCKALKYSYRLN